LSDRLYIYDAGDKLLGDGPHDADSHRLGITGGVKGLHQALGQLVNEGKTFTKVLWQTHGNAGLIRFKDKTTGDKSFIIAESWRGSEFIGKGYEKLFPKPTKMYFDGCNVAEGDDGWRFLENAGSLFLHEGGVVMGWTSSGFNLWFGHSVHFWGDVRYVSVGPKGVIKGRTDTDEIRRKEMRESGCVGMKC
jgi:hypothetical protein